MKMKLVSFRYLEIREWIKASKVLEWVISEILLMTEETNKNYRKMYPKVNRIHFKILEEAEEK